MVILHGTLDGAITQADVAFWAYYGAGIYTPGGAIRELRAVANLYRDSIHLVARADAVAQGVWPPKGGPAHLTTNMVSTIGLPTSTNVWPLAAKIREQAEGQLPKQEEAVDGNAG